MTLFPCEGTCEGIAGRFIGGAGTDGTDGTENLETPAFATGDALCSFFWGRKDGTFGAEYTFDDAFGVWEICFNFGIPPARMPANCEPTELSAGATCEEAEELWFACGANVGTFGADGCDEALLLNAVFELITPPPPVIGPDRSLVTAFFNLVPFLIELNNAFLSGVILGRAWEVGCAAAIPPAGGGGGGGGAGGPAIVCNVYFCTETK